jgi:hypothetical protein
MGISSLGGQVAIYDPKRDRMVLFGGDDDGTPRYDTWSLSMTESHPWLKLSPSGPTPPQPRYATGVYDPTRDRMLMLSGGWPDGATPNQVWALSLSGATQWSQVATTGPTPDMIGPTIYDPVRDRIILTDGSGDIWMLSLTGTPQWMKITTAATPPGFRYWPNIVYDSTRDRMLFWGGDSDEVFLPTDLWALSLSGTPTWAPVPTVDAPPLGRMATPLIYDPVNDRLVIYAGSNYHNTYDGWTVSLGGTPTWTQIDDTQRPYPPGRSFHTGVYDSARARMLIFSGYQFQHGAPDRADVWALSLKGGPLTWSPVRGTEPEPRALHSAVYDPDADRMLVYGGRSDYGLNYDGELWELSLDTRPTWNLIAPAGSGPHSDDYSPAISVYDDQKHRLIVFAQNGVWAYPFRGARGWARLEPQGTTPDGLHAAVYDERHHRAVVLANPNNAPWELSLSEHPRWRKIDVSASGTINGGSVAVYDKKRDRLLIWGGAAYGEGNNQEVWALSLSGQPRWTQIVPAGPYPKGRNGYSLVYDDKRDRLILHAGHTLEWDDYWTWELPLSGTPQWKGLDSTFDGYIILDDGHSAIYDPVRDRMIVFGGRYFYNSFDETWALQFGMPAASSATVAGVTMGLQPAYPNPFNPRVTIPFQLAHDGPVTLSIYDVSGRLVKTLADGWTSRGAHSVMWEGVGGSGERVASGVYFYRLTVGSRVETRKMVLLK